MGMDEDMVVLMSMRKVRIIVIAAVMMLIFAGCSSGELEYDPNLGYDLNEVRSKDIVFNVYHVNPKDHLMKSRVKI